MRLIIFILFAALTQACKAQATDSLRWIKQEFSTYDIYYTKADSGILNSLKNDLANGARETISFFHSSFSKKFSVYIFPRRGELNKQWQKDWNMPGFQSECWMVASGVADRLDILSPLAWRNEACDHNADDSIEVQKIITHELVHIYHGQHNPKPAFDGMDNLSWFIEGLATYASGQVTEERMNKVRAELKAGNVPKLLSEMWTGKEKYGRAGSFVQFVDKTFGREKLVGLLSLTSLDSMLKLLATNETSLIEMWRERTVQ
jgi:hypothetical protein